MLKSRFISPAAEFYGFFAADFSPHTFRGRGHSWIFRADTMAVYINTDFPRWCGDFTVADCLSVHFLNSK